MRLFLKRIIYFLIPGLIITISLELLLRNIPSTYSYKKHYLDANAQNIEVLILGGSSAYYDINPDYLKEKGFNAAYVAQSLNYDYEIFKKYDSKWANLKWIILPISYTSLFYRLENWRESWRVHNYIINYNLNTSSKIKDYFELLSLNFRFNVNKIFDYYIYKIKIASDCSALGWGADNKYRDQQNLSYTGKYWANLQTFKNVSVDSNLKIVKSIINFARKKNVKVFLFTEPAYHIYIESLDRNQLNQAINSAIDLKNNYDNVVYLNFLRDSSFTQKDFHDGYHLDEFGAQKLTLKIDSIIAKMEK